MPRWTLDDIPWDRFEPSRVTPPVLEIVKAVTMVERNGVQYAAIMKDLFSGDASLQAAAGAWAQEESQHGRALARWAKMADPTFDFDASYDRFARGYWLTIADKSLRTSRAADLMARCVVEVGTSTYYSSIRDATEEPVLKEICRHIAIDEVHHYMLFYRNMLRYARGDGFGFWRKLKVAVVRMFQVADDEMAYAYFAANGCDGSYDRKRHSRAFLRRAYALLRREHVDHAVRMISRAVGARSRGRLQDWAAHAGFRLIQRRARQLARIGDS
jgi:hypothetical protein